MFLPLHLLHRFEFSTVIRGSEVEKLITLGCLGTLELVPLGCLGALDGLWCRGAQSLWCKAPGKLRGLQLSCGDCPGQFVRVR